jgi:hypothetical protein
VPRDAAAGRLQAGRTSGWLPNAGRHGDSGHSTTVQRKDRSRTEVRVDDLSPPLQSGTRPPADAAWCPFWPRVVARPHRAGPEPEGGRARWPFDGSPVGPHHQEVARRDGRRYEHDSAPATSRPGNTNTSRAPVHESGPSEHTSFGTGCRATDKKEPCSLERSPHPCPPGPARCAVCAGDPPAPSVSTAPRTAAQASSRKTSPARPRAAGSAAIRAASADPACPKDFRQAIQRTTCGEE